MTTLDEKGLAPCPFCDNDGSGRIEDALHIIHNEPSEWRARDTWSVQCDECTATMGYSDSPDEAVAAWNRRAPAQSINAEMLEALEDIHDALDDALDLSNQEPVQ